MQQLCAYGNSVYTLKHCLVRRSDPRCFWTEAARQPVPVPVPVPVGIGVLLFLCAVTYRVAPHFTKITDINGPLLKGVLGALGRSEG